MISFNFAAHYGTVKDSKAATLLNRKEVRTAENVIILPVTATPYSLVTQNSRLDNEILFSLLENNSIGFLRTSALTSMKR